MTAHPNLFLLTALLYQTERAPEKLGGTERSNVLVDHPSIARSVLA
jgi:hypothetical protein